MTEIPGHSLPRYSDEAADDALFHYTTAEGLIGILQTGEIWSTAYYCSNDETELTAGKGLLTPVFKGVTAKLVKEQSPLPQTFVQRGVDPMHYADHFEQLITGVAFSHLCAYITCFFRPSGEEDFLHGLLSQWRAYGSDGGYAIQFSKRKLLSAIEKASNPEGLQYDLRDVFYSPENELKSSVLGHKDAFVAAYMQHLERLAAPPGDLLSTKTVPSPIKDLLGGPLESLIDYLVHTKSPHFAEERECRLSSIPLTVPEPALFPTHYFSRRGLVVPYKKTLAAAFPLLDCIEWILIGPSPHMRDRFRSVSQLVQTKRLSIRVRPSKIPFRR